MVVNYGIFKDTSIQLRKWPLQLAEWVQLVWQCSFFERKMLDLPDNALSKFHKWERSQRFIFRIYAEGCIIIESQYANQSASNHSKLQANKLNFSLPVLPGYHSKNKNESLHSSTKKRRRSIPSLKNVKRRLSYSKNAEPR